ncbi:MAG TPA: ROK family protein [Solirubrobacteraceae bacterium]|jgi:glucokinase|nr:ROK family protein [Solirubrobacteraceae bacterium]
MSFTYGGIDLGGTKIEAILLDAGSGKVLGQSRRPTPTQGGPQAIAKAMADTLGEAAAEAKLHLDVLDAVGVGSPGEVDPDTGSVANARNLSEWEDSFPLAAVLSEQVGAKVMVGNDVDVATLAEFELGAGRDVSSLLGVFWGTGVGGGLVLDGQLWRGRDSAGEIGHMVVKRKGARCPCGRRGCMEAYSGRKAMEQRARREAERGQKTALFSIMRDHGRDSLSSGVWAHALEHGDALAHRLVDRAVKALGAGVASAVNLLDVELVVIGGGLGTRFGPQMAARIDDAMRPHLFNDHRPPEVRVAGLGDLGGAIGATLLCGPIAGAQIHLAADPS